MPAWYRSGSADLLSARPGQRPMPNRDQRHDHERDARENEGVAQVERGRRDHHGREEHQREGIGDAAGEIEKRRELQHVEGEINRRLTIGRAMAGRIAQRQDDIEHRACADEAGALCERQGITETEIDDEQGRRLSADGQPAQVGQRTQPDAAARRRRRRGWRMSLRGLFLSDLPCPLPHRTQIGHFSTTPKGTIYPREGLINCGNLHAPPLSSS